MHIPKVAQTKILNKKCVLCTVIKELKDAYPEERNAYQAAKQHLVTLRDLLTNYDEKGNDYNLTVTEILFFEWLVKETKETLLKEYQVSQN